MALSSKQRQHLKAQAHSLKPVVMIGGNGLTEAVMAEIEIAIAHHELIKVKIGVGEKEDRQAVCDSITNELNCELVQLIGRVGIFYRPSDKHKISLP